MPDFDDDDFRDDKRTEDSISHYEIEREESNGNRDVYINRKLVYSNQYITAIKSLGENRYCTKSILFAARTMLEHHHGDKYEDLYFIDSENGKMLFQTDYREHEQKVEQKVLPTEKMKKWQKKPILLLQCTIIRPIHYQALMIFKIAILKNTNTD